jgi:hypothetical protein
MRNLEVMLVGGDPDDVGGDVQLMHRGIEMCQ